MEKSDILGLFHSPYSGCTSCLNSATAYIDVATSHTVPEKVCIETSTSYVVPATDCVEDVVSHIEAASDFKVPEIAPMVAAIDDKSTVTA